MNLHNIKYAVVSGPMESLEIYTKADKRFIPGYHKMHYTPLNKKLYKYLTCIAFLLPGSSENIHEL